MDAAEQLEIIGRAFACAGDVAGAIRAKLVARSFQPRSTILWQDDAGSHVYLVFSGRAQAIAYSVEGQLVLLHVFQAGDIFGEQAVLGAGGGRVAGEEVVAATRVEAGLFAAAIFIALMENYACVALAVTRLLMERLSVTTRRMVEASTLSATGRICAELLRQARASVDLSIRPAPVFSEFALLAQTTRETVSRTVNDLERRGIVRREPDRLVVVAPHRLEELIV